MPQPENQKKCHDVSMGLRHNTDIGQTDGQTDGFAIIISRSACIARMMRDENELYRKWLVSECFQAKSRVTWSFKIIPRLEPILVLFSHACTYALIV